MVNHQVGEGDTIDSPAKGSPLCPLVMLTLALAAFFIGWAATTQMKVARERAAQPYWQSRGFDSYAAYAEHERITGRTPLPEVEASKPRVALATPLPASKDDDRPVALPDPPEKLPREGLTRPVHRIEFDRQPGAGPYAGPWRIVVYTGWETKDHPAYRVWIVNSWKMLAHGWVEFDDPDSTGKRYVQAHVIEPCPEGTTPHDGDGSTAPGALVPVPQVLPPLPPPG